jgi:hypothetical protein
MKIGLVAIELAILETKNDQSATEFSLTETGFCLVTFKISIAAPKIGYENLMAKANPAT